MNDIFVDGIRSIAVANGVARIELLQLRRGQSQTKLDPEVTAILLLPVAALKDFSSQLAGTLDKLSQAAKTRSAESSGAAVESALENL
ncbi:MAG: hypothetical protein ACTSQ7_03630 [Alphaproteobacteria bacterium]